MTIRIGKKFFIIAALIIAAVAGAYGYYHFYYMRTPEYTLQIIRTAVKDHDADTFNKHVDIDSIIGKWIDGEMEKDESIKANPFAAALIPVAKNILTTSVKNAVNRGYYGYAEGCRCKHIRAKHAGRYAHLRKGRPLCRQHFFCQKCRQNGRHQYCR